MLPRECLEMGSELPRIEKTVYENVECWVIGKFLGGEIGNGKWARLPRRASE